MPATETAGFVRRMHCIVCQGERLQELAGGRFDEGAVGRFISQDPWGEEHPAPFLAGQHWSLVECADCGQKFHRNILDEQWNERRFSRWMSQEAIETFEESGKTPDGSFRRGLRYGEHIVQIESLTRSIRGGSAVRILDFGCGYGEFLAMCALHGFTAAGVDRSSAKRGHGKFVHVFADLAQAQAVEKFHALTLFEVLEHLDDPRHLLEQLSGLLVEGGVLVLETPDCSNVTDIQTLQDYRLIHPLDHINAFTPRTLGQLASQLGFVEIKRPIAVMACDWREVVKRVGKKLLRPMLKPTTQLYFRKI